MQLTGHKTDSVYRRYRSVDEADRREALQRMQATIRAAPKAAVTASPKPGNLDTEVPTRTIPAQSEGVTEVTPSQLCEKWCAQEESNL